MTNQTAVFGEAVLDGGPVESCSFNWVIPDFKVVFDELNKKKEPINERRGRGLGNISDLELISETFIRGQFVGRTAVWQMELRRNGTHLGVGLSCLQCFHADINEIWTRFDTYIVDFDGKICHAAGDGSYFDSDNITKFTPADKVGDKKDAKPLGRCSFWEMDLISMTELQKKWDKLLPRNFLNLRLRLSVYREKPFSEASHLAEFHEPVKLCYTKNSQLSLNNPFYQVMKDLWTSRENPDVSFAVEGNIVKAHKFIVSVQSPVLKTMINANQTDKDIEIPDVTLESFQNLLKYIYLQILEEIDVSLDINFIVGVLRISNQFQVEPLAKICLVRLLTNMSVENFCETAFAIYTNVSKEKSFFKTEVKKFFMQNQKTLKESKHFLNAAKEHRKEFLEICFETVPIIK